MNLDEILAPEQDPSGKLAEFAAKLKYEDIPAEQQDYVKRDILDAMASLLAGSTGPAVPTVLASARSWNCTGKGKVLVYGDALPETLAAFVNGTMARACDIGDTGVTGGHVCEWIIPTLLTGLSRAGGPVSGKDFMAAFVAGSEWGAREHTAIHLQYHTNTIPGECAGSRYATVALARMYGFDTEEMWSAAGMSFLQHTATSQQKYNEGTPDVRVQHGYVASDAIQICDLVKRGMRSVHGIYMSVGGLFHHIKHGDIMDPDFMTEDLGKKWVWKENITNKLYGGVYYCHTPIYGVLSLMKEHNIKKEDIKSIHFVTAAGCRCTTEPLEEKQNPKTPEAAMFSNPYAITHAIFTGDCFRDAFLEETFKANMANPEFVEYMKKMSFEIDPSITTAFDNYPITITLNDGRQFSKVEGGLPGNQANPVTWEQVIDKFWKTTRYAAVDLGEEKYNKVIEICKHLEEIDDMRCLLDAMTP